MAWRRDKRNSRTHDDPALPQACQHHIEQLALVRGRTGDQATVARDDLEFGDVVDLRAVQVARVAEPTYAERSPHGEGHARGWEYSGGQPLGERGGRYVRPKRAKLCIHALCGGWINGTEGARINDDTCLSLGLAIH